MQSVRACPPSFRFDSFFSSIVDVHLFTFNCAVSFIYHIYILFLFSLFFFSSVCSSNHFSFFIFFFVNKMGFAKGFFIVYLRESEASERRSANGFFFFREIPSRPAGNRIFSLWASFISRRKRAFSSYSSS